MDTSDLLALLTLGDLEISGRILGASNTTLYAAVTLDGVTQPCVYKPVAGERPLWDFPRRTLARREVAAYDLAQGMDFDGVPPTVLRDGPLGEGSVQWWISAGTGEDGLPLAAVPGAGLVDVVPAGQVPAGWFDVVDAEDPGGRPVSLVHADDPALRTLALFDVIANNTDRKGGHVLREAGGTGPDPLRGAVFGVDHGLTFSVDDKLRTVLWGWAGDPLGEEACDRLDRLTSGLEPGARLHERLLGLLSRAEVSRTAERAATLRRRGRFPRPLGGWPSLPWPPF